MELDSAGGAAVFRRKQERRESRLCVGGRRVVVHWGACRAQWQRPPTTALGVEAGASAPRLGTRSCAVALLVGQRSQSVAMPASASAYRGIAKVLACWPVRRLSAPCQATRSSNHHPELPTNI